MRSLAGVFAAALAVGLANAASAQPTSLSDYTLFANHRLKIGSVAIAFNGAVGSNEEVKVKGDSSVSGPLVGDTVTIGAASFVYGSVYGNSVTAPAGAIKGATVSPIAFPIIVPPTPAAVSPGVVDVFVPPGAARTIGAGSYRKIDIQDSAQVTLNGSIDADIFVTHGTNGQLGCSAVADCNVGVKSLLKVTSQVGTFGVGRIHFRYAGGKTVKVGYPGAFVSADFQAPFAHLKLLSSLRRIGNYIGQFTADRVSLGNGGAAQRLGATPLCGDGILGGSEDCDPPSDATCPGTCRPDCLCAGAPHGFALHSVGPSLLNNATNFGVQLFGQGFQAGAQLELSDKSTNAVIETLPTTFVSSTELTASIPAGMPVASGIQRELVARVINPDLTHSISPDIGHCKTDAPNSPIACIADANCPAGTGPCILGDQRLTMFNNQVFLNPNSAVVVPDPYGVCDDGAPCAGAADCSGVGSGACSRKLYVTPQERDELWVYNTGTEQFVDEDTVAPGIQGIAVGDNPFHVQLLTAGGNPRAWVVNRFDDALSIVDPASDSELARVTGAALGAAGRLRMSTEIEFNRAGTRAYISNQNLDEVLVLDISGGHRDTPLLIGAVDVGVNPRGMATNTADTRLYVANIQSADVSVVDIMAGSGTENQVIATIATRATDTFVGGRLANWKDFVISGRAPRGIIFSDDLQALFVSSIGPQIGPRPGVSQTGGTIVSPSITVIDAGSNAIIGHVALNGTDPDRYKCTDPELMALDDVRGRLYVTCQGSGTIDMLDTASLVAASAAELNTLALPLPTDVSVPTLPIPAVVGTFGAKVCAAFTGNPGTPCITDSQCTSCPALRDGLPVNCCSTNNPDGLHNGPRGIALSEDNDTLYVVNQFTTSIATIDVSPASATAATVTNMTSFPGAFGSDNQQRDRRLGQIEFFTDVKGTNTSCATCHIDDHQDGVFFEADVAGPRLRRVLSVRGTRDFPPLLQDQLLPDLVAFTDVVVHVERFGPVCTPCTELGGVFTCFPPPDATCNMTSNAENQDNTLYAKAVTFFPNPNLNPDGSFSTALPLPGGVSGNAVHGGQLFDQLACTSCHPEPMFTIDQFRVFQPMGLSIQHVRMREVQTPVNLPLRSKCQDANRPMGVDGSSGFSVPTLRGIWDTFPLLVSGSAGLQVVGSEPAFSPCTPGSSGCCTQLQSPLNPDGTAVPEEHLAVGTKDAMRALLTAPLAVPASGHGAALGLSATDLNDLIAYLRSL
jgi:DNA-binding beta-propeller fold protein YncE